MKPMSKVLPWPGGVSRKAFAPLDSLGTVKLPKRLDPKALRWTPY